MKEISTISLWPSPFLLIFVCWWWWVVLAQRSLWKVWRAYFAHCTVLGGNVVQRHRVAFAVRIYVEREKFSESADKQCSGRRVYDAPVKLLRSIELSTRQMTAMLRSWFRKRLAEGTVCNSPLLIQGWLRFPCDGISNVRALSVWRMGSLLIVWRLEKYRRVAQVFISGPMQLALSASCSIIPVFA